MNDLHAIVQRLGGHLYAGGTRALVPGPGHSRKDRSLSLYLSGQKVVWHSFAEHGADAITGYLGIAPSDQAPMSTTQRRRARRDRAVQIQAEQVAKRTWCHDLWDRCLPAQGSLVETYLREARRIPIREVPRALRWHPQAPRGYSTPRTSPAMVARIDDEHGTPCGLHLTFLRPDGSWHDGRIMVGTARGGAVRLYQADTELAVAEGIETALSYAYLHHMPTWALLTTSQMHSWACPLSVDRLVIAADGGTLEDGRRPGLEAAETLLRRTRTAQVRVHADPVGDDWNKALMEGVG